MNEAVQAALSIPDTLSYLYSLRDRLPVFTVYDHPTDWPDFYVARLHLCVPRPCPMPFAIMDRSLERIQVTMEALGLVKLMPSPDDDPIILETWL